MHTGTQSPLTKGGAARWVRVRANGLRARPPLNPVVGESHPPSSRMTTGGSNTQLMKQEENSHRIRNERSRRKPMNCLETAASKEGFQVVARIVVTHGRFLGIRVAKVSFALARIAPA